MHSLIGHFEETFLPPAVFITLTSPRSRTVGLSSDSSSEQWAMIVLKVGWKIGPTQRPGIPTELCNALPKRMVATLPKELLTALAIFALSTH